MHSWIDAIAGVSVRGRSTSEPVSYFIMQFQKISVLPSPKVFWLCTPLLPRNSSLASYFASKILACKTPLSLGISDDLPWGGYVFFLELYILH